MLTLQSPIKTYLSSLQPQPVADPCSHPGMSYYIICAIYFHAVIARCSTHLHLICCCCSPRYTQSINEHGLIPQRIQRMLHMLAQPKARNFMECECLSGFILSLVAFLCVHILMAAWLRNLTRQHMFLSQVGLSEQIKGSSNGAIPKKVIDAPFVQIPLGVTEDRLVGTVDIEASMKVCNLEQCVGMHRLPRFSIEQCMGLPRFQQIWHALSAINVPCY